MTLAELRDFLCDWYETSADALGLSPETVPAELNEIVREFYLTFGALAQRDSPFGHTDSHFGPLSAQDHLYPADDLKLEDGCYIHLMENQGNFAAGSKSDSDTVFLKGDVGDDRFFEFAPTEIPLEESLVACALMETVMSVGDRERLVTVDDTRRNRALALSGSRRTLRTVHDDYAFSYWFTPDLIAFGFEDTPEHFAHRGAWRQKPPVFQDVEFEGGGSSSSGPTKLTRELEVERLRTLNEAREAKRGR